MLVVRHGQSEWNALGRWQGQEDPPLTDLGRQQASLASGRIGAVDMVVASDLQRASETAAIIATELGVGPVIVEPGLKERHAGEWQGMTKPEIEQAWPGWLENRRRPPGFEPTDEFLGRVTDALDRLETAHRGASMLVVSHGGVIYVIEEHHAEPFERIPNLGGRHVSHRGPGQPLVLGDRVLLVDDEHFASQPRQL